MSLAYVVVLGTMSVNPWLDEARGPYSQQKWAEAEHLLVLACESTGSTLDERRAAHDLLARTYSALGRATDAESTYRRLLAEDPLAPAPTDAAPKIRDAFRRAKEGLYPPGTATLSRSPSRPGTIEVALIDPWSIVSHLTLIEPGAAPIEMTVTQGYATAATEAKSYSIEARDAAGRIVASLVVQSNARATAPGPEPVATVAAPFPWRWVFTGLGVASALATVGLAIGASLDAGAVGGKSSSTAKAWGAGVMGAVTLGLGVAAVLAFTW